METMRKAELKELLEELHDRYNRPEFIESDPVSVPHAFSAAEDIEISGFLASTIAWGNRKAIVGSARRMMRYMDDSPYDFTLNASDAELGRLATCVHRTFNGADFIAFVRALRHLYVERGGLGAFFTEAYARTGDMRRVLSEFRALFFSTGHDPHCEKHLSSIDRGAACKRLNMYIRWMVRRDGRGVDFGLWEGIPASALYVPLDLHTGNVGRALGLLRRRQNDWKAVEELTGALRELDAEDPVKYDFALFGAGIGGAVRN